MDDKKELTWILRDSKTALAAGNAIARLVPSKEQTYIVRVKLESEQRRSKQNRLSFMWYKELGEQTGHGKKHERCRCKLMHGIPIMREHQWFNDMWQATLGCFTYEQQMMAIEHFDVTSLMTVQEFARYLTEIDQEASSMGIVLTHPDDIYWAALMKEGR